MTVAAESSESSQASSPKQLPPALAFSFDGANGAPIHLADFQGKAILIVNTASQCGFTSQYKGLQRMWQTYKDRGLVVLAIPSNDFGAQEPGTNAEIQQFCTNVYGLGFPVAGKTVVKGKKAHPFYRYALQTLGGKAAPRWNFHKYLINANGELVDWFSSSTEPMERVVTKAVERALPPAPRARLQQDNVY
ncbi:MAG: glutathione peroxidase [Rickettsiales bacterium]|nr:glutathione peroxidase [Rickettsiales bacterium]